MCGNLRSMQHSNSCLPAHVPALRWNDLVHIVVLRAAASSRASRSLPISRSATRSATGGGSRDGHSHRHALHHWHGLGRLAVRAHALGRGLRGGGRARGRPLVGLCPEAEAHGRDHEEEAADGAAHRRANHRSAVVGGAVAAAAACAWSNAFRLSARYMAGQEAGGFPWGDARERAAEARRGGPEAWGGVRRPTWANETRLLSRSRRRR